MHSMLHTAHVRRSVLSILCRILLMEWPIRYAEVSSGKHLGYHIFLVANGLGLHKGNLITFFSGHYSQNSMNEHGDSKVACGEGDLDSTTSLLNEKTILLDFQLIRSGAAMAYLFGSKFVQKYDLALQTFTGAILSQVAVENSA